VSHHPTDLEIEFKRVSWWIRFGVVMLVFILIALVRML
jgi:hypothetical protein